MGVWALPSAHALACCTQGACCANAHLLGAAGGLCTVTVRMASPHAPCTTLLCRAPTQARTPTGTQGAVRNQLISAPVPARAQGDRLDTDILLGAEGGLRTIMPMTGVTTAEELADAVARSDEPGALPVPDFVIPSVAALAGLP